MDASNMLKPMLARGELHAIGATTLDEYRKYIEKDAALERRFQQVYAKEPTVSDTVSILRGLKEKYEVHHGIRIKDSALVAAATLSNRYISDRFLPDKAIDLVDEAADEWQVDSLGNLIVTKKGTGQSDLRVLIDAHMDEVGLMITGVDRDGTCKFMTVGGIDDRSLLGKVVRVGPKKLTGVIGARPIHLLKSSQRNSVVKADAMRIDIGAKSKDGAARKVNPGDTATFDTAYEEAGDYANFAFATDGCCHRFSRGLTLEVQVCANEEQAGIFGISFGVKGGNRNASFGSCIDGAGDNRCADGQARLPGSLISHPADDITTPGRFR